MTEKAKGLLSNEWIKMIISLVTLVAALTAATWKMSSAYEHRATINEQNIKVQADKTVVHDALIKELTTKMETITINQARTVAILDIIDRRHSLEDQRRIVGQKPGDGK